MRQYRRIQWRIVGIVLVYTAVALGAKWQTGDELFPFFNWSLFTTVPNEKHDYGLRITAVAGEPVVPSRYFEKASQWFAQADSIVAYNAIQDFGRAVRAEDAAAVAEIRPYIETLYLENQVVVYEVVRRTYTPLVRWRSGAFDRERVLATFEAAP